MNDWDYWLVWLALVVSSFALWEFVAIWTGHRERTLTYWIRSKLGLETKLEPTKLAKTLSTLFALALLLFNGWFIPHIVWGWWGGSA